MDAEDLVTWVHDNATPDRWARILACARLPRDMPLGQVVDSVDRFSAIRTAFAGAADVALSAAHQRPSPGLRRRAGLPADSPGPRPQDRVPVFAPPPDRAPWSSVLTAMESWNEGRLAIVGPPGVGKTRVAAWAAALGRDRWPGGVVWVDVQEELDPVWGLARWSRALLGPMETSAPDRARAVLRYCARNRALLVLDGLDGEPESWLRGLPLDAVLATSRAVPQGFESLSLAPPAVENLAATSVLNGAELRSAAGPRASRLDRRDGRAHALALGLAAAALAQSESAGAFALWAWSRIEPADGAPAPALADALELAMPAQQQRQDLERVLRADPGSLPYAVQTRLLQAGSRFVRLDSEAHLAWLRLGIEFALADLAADHPGGALRTLRLLASVEREVEHDPDGLQILLAYHTGRALMALACFSEAFDQLDRAGALLAALPPTRGRAQLLSRTLTLRSRCLECLGDVDGAARERAVALELDEATL